MPIQIIDGFQVNTSSSIDNRIVASGSTARNLIPYKYEGLRVFDLFDGIPYVWYNGSWVSENASGVVGSSTTANYIPLYTSSNVVGNSIIYQSSGGKVGVNTITPSETFEVNGKVKVSGTNPGFIGSGSGITNLNATNISSGSLSLSRLTNGSTGWLLAGGSSNPLYVNPTQISVGTSSVSLTSITASNVTLSSSSSSTNYVLFSPNSTIGGPVRINSSLMYDASNGNLKSGGFMMGDSSDYVIRKNIYYSSSWGSGSSNNVTIGSISISSGIVCFIEATFVAKNTSTSTNYSTSKISGMFYNNGGTITQVSTTTTSVNINNNSGSLSIDPGSFNISGSSIQFKQTVTSSLSNSYSVNVDYKITAVS